MMNFLKLNWINILTVMTTIFLLVYLYRTGKRDTVKKIILGLVIQAEKALGSGTGELKYAMVVERAYNVLPTLIRFLITKKELDYLIEEAVRQMKILLCDAAAEGGEADDKQQGNQGFAPQAAAELQKAHRSML